MFMRGGLGGGGRTLCLKGTLALAPSLSQALCPATRCSWGPGRGWSLRACWPSSLSSRSRGWLDKEGQGEASESPSCFVCLCVRVCVTHHKTLSPNPYQIPCYLPQNSNQGHPALFCLSMEEFSGIVMRLGLGPRPPGSPTYQFCELDSIFPVPLFSHLKNWHLNHSEQCPAHNQYATNIKSC